MQHRNGAGILLRVQNGMSNSQKDRRGIYDGFESYRSASEDDYRRALSSGIVVPDANVLLNLYRYAAHAREDLFSVFEALAERLWVPHRVVEEFWRNRESVTRSLREQANRTCKDLQGEEASAVDLISEWANRVSAPAELRQRMLDDLRNCFAGLEEDIMTSVDSELAECAARTHSDPVLNRLEPLLVGRVGPPLPESEQDAIAAEGRRRMDHNIPPGFKDKGKAEGQAIGDFIVWEQILREAAASSRDIVFVTGDKKDDWWRKVSGAIQGPRIELIDELRGRAGTRLFMLRPDGLLTLAKKLLGSVVRDETVRNVETVDRMSGGGSWTAASIAELLAGLDVAGNVQADVIRHAAAAGGFIDRATVYEICDFDEDRSLRGFTRPIRRITQNLKDEGIVAADAIDVLEPVYEGTGWTQACGFRVPSELVPLIGSVRQDLPSALDLRGSAAFDVHEQ